MKQTICWMCVVFLGVGGAAVASDELTDPMEILKRVDAATKAVSAVRCATTVVPTGANASREPRLEGTVELSGWANGSPKMFRYDLTVRQPNSTETTRYTAGSDGENFFLIDHAKKTAYVDIDPAVLGSAGRLLGTFTTVEFVHPSPFSDEINGKKAELKGSRTVGGEDCYEIHVVYANEAQQATWCFSKKDFLPRCRIDRFDRGEGQEPTVREKSITQLVVDPKFDKDPFKFELPEGYTQVDDFAP